MSEPTIDELLTWMNAEVGYSSTRENYEAYQAGIRGVLEHYRNVKRGELQAIRAFVERVVDRWKNCKSDSLVSTTPWRDAMMEELAAMEKETQTQ